MQNVKPFLWCFFRFLQLVFLIIPNVNVTNYFGLVGAILLQLVGVIKIKKIDTLFESSRLFSYQTV